VTRYDWRAQERRFNQFDQFKTTIDGVEIYFIHQRSKNANATPLLLLNGWPSSIMEYEKVIGPLTDPVAYGGRVEDSFNVVIPSMPGFGFSGKPRERGYNPERIAKIWVQLMARLGYTKYAAHGSDWGSGIATRVALDDASHVMALHLAGCGGAAPAPAGGAPLAAPPPAPPAQGINSLVNGAHNLGYQEIQSTKPQTLGFGLSDSPVGLASWILEKWYNWSDHDGDIEKAFTKDELLTNIMIYWVTNSGTSSSRIYFESRHMNGGPLPASPFVTPTGRVAAPTGCGAFPYQYDRRATPPNPNLEAARKGAPKRGSTLFTSRRCRTAGISGRSSSRSCGWTTSAPSWPRYATVTSHRGGVRRAADYLADVLSRGDELYGSVTVALAKRERHYRPAAPGPSGMCGGFRPGVQCVNGWGHHCAGCGREPSCRGVLSGEGILLVGTLMHARGAHFRRPGVQAQEHRP
jgi:pimeloyl-ACP methyl ester carboxylesterase